MSEGLGGGGGDGGVGGGGDGLGGGQNDRDLLLSDGVQSIALYSKII